MLHRSTVYSLTALVLAMLGMMATILSLGAYTMSDMCKDVAVIMWCIALTDCIYNVLKGWLE